MERKKVLELALEALHAQRAAVEAEISQLKSEIAHLAGGTHHEAAVAKAPKGRRTKTAEERRQHSEKMKQIWAARKAKTGKAGEAKVAVKAGSAAAANKARSEKMKAYWAKKLKGNK